MKKWLVLSILAVGVLLGGCATGRFAAIDLDMRDKEQIQAFYPEAAIPYQDTSTNAIVRAQAEAMPVPWQFIFDFLKVAKMRVRILSVEWRMQ